MKKSILAIAAILSLYACSNTRKATGGETSVNATIVNTTWTLVQLEGKPITKGSNQEQTAHFKLQPDGRVSGHTGCNGLGGEYKLEAGNRIRFSNMLGTLMYCDNVPWEADYKEVFTLADNYTLSHDTLRLNIGRRAPLAVFVAGGK